jgi:hypothetical protein
MASDVQGLAGAAVNIGEVHLAITLLMPFKVTG